MQLNPKKIYLKNKWLWYEKNNDKVNNWYEQYKVIKNVKTVFDLWQFINNTNNIYSTCIEFKKKKKFNAEYYLLYKDGYNICVENNKNHGGIIQCIIDFNEYIFDIIENLTLEICGCLINENIYAIRYVVKWDIKHNKDVLKIELWYNNDEKNIMELINSFNKYKLKFVHIDKVY